MAAGLAGALLGGAIGHRLDRSIVACAYAGTTGVPALFPRRYFPALESIEGDRGAKAVIEAHAADVERVPCDEAGTDLDGPDDLPGRGPVRPGATPPKP